MTSLPGYDTNILTVGASETEFLLVGAYNSDLPQNCSLNTSHSARDTGFYCRRMPKIPSTVKVDSAYSFGAELPNSGLRNFA